MPGVSLSLIRSNKKTNTTKIITINDEIIVIKDNLKKKLGNTKISISTLHIVIKECIELMDKLNIPGSEKKKHAIIIIKALLSDYVEDQDQLEILIKIIDEQLIENTIDLIIDSSKGKLDINSKKRETVIIGCATFLTEIINCICKKLSKKK